MINKDRGISLSIKFLLLSLALLLCNLTLSFFAYREIHNRSLEAEVSAAAEQTLAAVNGNIDTLLSSVNNYSKLILSDSVVQNNLRKGFAHHDLEFYRELKFFLGNIINTFPEISAIHLCDLNGRVFDVKSTRQSNLILNGDVRSHWFREAEKGRGASELLPGDSDLYIGREGVNLISSARQVNDLETQKPIGALVLSFEKSLLNKGNLPLALYDDSGALITENRSAFEDRSEDHIITSSRENGRTGWTIELYSDLEDETHSLNSLSLLLLYIIMVNSFFLLFGAFIVSRVLVHPLENITRVMRENSHKDFRKISIQSSIQEVRNLSEGYNLTIEEIQRLIGRVTEEQKLKREKEWQALQAQIKPHFLYNTFDAVSALALMGRNDDVFTLMSSLGKYYRSSLSSREEIWTLKKEIDLVRNYVRILKFRYEDLFELEVDVEAELDELLLPKLILQPLVENAVYHGIKPGRRKGLVRIGAHKYGSVAQLSVKDNGVGINDDDLAEALVSGFGLGGTRDRLELYFGSADILRVESLPDSGTTVFISLKEAALV